MLFLAYYSYSDYLVTTSSSISGTVVVIDAGHGIPDNGACSENGIYENEINLKIAKKLKSLLKRNKVNVIMTRNNMHSLSNSKTNNKRDDLRKRVEIRDNSDADIFISIHLNHFNESKYYGAQVFYSPDNEKSMLLAKNIQSKLIELADPTNTRNIKSGSGIYILKDSKIPAVLVECGFLSNANEAEKLATDEYQDKIAWSVYTGLCKYMEGEDTKKFLRR